MCLIGMLHRAYVPSKGRHSSITDAASTSFDQSHYATPPPPSPQLPLISMHLSEAVLHKWDAAAAGENWRYTMYDLRISPPHCTPGEEGITDCGFKLGATLFFITFIMIQTYLLTNLFVAAILEYVASGLLRERLFLTPEHLDRFQVGCVHTFSCTATRFSMSLSP